MTTDLTFLATFPGRCPACLMHTESQGHRAEMDGRLTGCTPSGPVGLELARKARDKGMQRTVAAHPDAVTLIDAAIMRRVNARVPFSANTIRAELADLQPNERNCIGARMNSVAKRNCKAIGEEVSTDVGTHGKKVTIWLSKAVSQERAA